MDDGGIVELYWQRDEAALRETEAKYGRYLTQIACNILGDPEDGRESVNDVYWKAWNSMPPHRPRSLAAYLGKLARETAIDRFRGRKREKRRASEYALSLSELEDCVDGGDTTLQGAELRRLEGAISAYVSGLPPEARRAFVGRYYFADSIREVAACCGMSESKAKSLLFRTRAGLKRHLKEEGFDV